MNQSPNFSEKTAHQLSWKQLGLALLDTTQTGILVTDCNFETIFSNRMVQEQMAVSHGSLLETTLPELARPAQAILEAPIPISDIHFTRPPRKFKAQISPILHNQRVVAILFLLEDVTQLQALEKKINEKQTPKSKGEETFLDHPVTALPSRKIIAKSQNFKTILKSVTKIARVDSPVLILGESGTGKGIIAEMIHYHSNRWDKSMIRLNCATIPEALMESELFGYKKGAFPGTDNDKAGSIEMADKGVLFLDEISNIPLTSQTKLLWFLEEGCLDRLDETANKKVNVRMIASTSESLETMVAEKAFRQDLYYRLKVIPIHLPPLRNRKACILPLISHYLKYFSKKQGTNGPITLSNNAANTLEKYAYPGNIRELINICERLVVLNDKNNIRSRDLPQSLMDCAGYETLFKEVQNQTLSHREMMEIFERQIIKNAMDRHQTQSKAAKVLGLNQSTIARKLQKHNLIQQEN